MESIFSQSDPNDINIMLRSIGMKIKFRTVKGDVEYQITGITESPLYRIRTRYYSLCDYYLKRHGLRLKRLELPCFVCNPLFPNANKTYLMPPEVCMGPFHIDPLTHLEVNGSFIN
jgi:hypothetical protein